MEQLSSYKLYLLSTEACAWQSVCVTFTNMQCRCRLFITVAGLINLCCGIITGNSFLLLQFIIRCEFFALDSHFHCPAFSKVGSLWTMKFWFTKLVSPEILISDQRNTNSSLSQEIQTNTVKCRITLFHLPYKHAFWRMRLKQQKKPTFWEIIKNCRCACIIYITVNFQCAYILVEAHVHL